MLTEFIVAVCQQAKHSHEPHIVVSKEAMRNGQVCARTYRYRTEYENGFGVLTGRPEDH